MEILDNAGAFSVSREPLRGLLNPLQEGFTALRNFLDGQISAFEPEVQPLVRECFLHSGKMLRPTLVFALYADERLECTEEVVKAAAIVELVHLATLVHDDILDEAEVRHRSTTMVSRYDAHTAVLLGDALFAHALHLASEFSTVEICKVVSRATRQVCSGEIAQTFNRGSLPDRKAYFRMIDLKTAELFKASAYLGAFLAGLANAEREAARSFARHLGIAYQILDDTADIFAEEKSAGKTLGTDAASGKATLPVLLWFQTLKGSERRTFVDHWNNGAPQLSQLRQRLWQDGVGEQLERAFQDELANAGDALTHLASGHRKTRLSELASFLDDSWNKVVPRRFQQV